MEVQHPTRETFARRVAAYDPITDTAGFRDLVLDAGSVLGLSDAALAEMFDVSRPTVSRWKQGQTTPYYVLRRLVRQKLETALATRT